MENWILLFSFVTLLSITFIFKKLWLGALVAIVISSISKIFFSTTIDELGIPFLRSIIISFELILLLFGAYLFYIALFNSGHFASFTKKTATFSSKLSVLMILCLFMGSFMEGIAGFGIPAMLIAPLLLTLGYKPITSIVLPLASNTIAVTFGALGTPFKIGLGITTLDPTVYYTIGLSILPILSMPFMLAFLYGKTEQTKIDYAKEWKMLLGAGFCFLIPFVITSRYSLEYPSVIAGFLGLIFFILFFIPKIEKPSVLFWWNTFYPYVFFVILLLVSKHFLLDYQWKIDPNLKSISLYQPGLIFIISIVFYLLATHKKEYSAIFFTHAKTTSYKIGKPILTIALLVGFTQLIQSDITTISNSFYSDDVLKNFKFIVIPITGVFGSFITGSATMSNLLLNNSVRITEIAQSSLALQLALLHTGSAMGNAISFQNIIMVKSVVNDPISESKILQYTSILVFLFLCMVIISGLILRT